MRVAPLFETLDDLDHSESAMEQLLSNPWYSAHIKGEQECMIGYSDSGKDAGRNKATLVSAIGIEAARARRDALAQEAQAALDELALRNRTGTLAEAARFTVARKS